MRNAEWLLQQLRADNTSGATQLLELAVEILGNFADESRLTEQDDFYQELVSIVHAVIAAQPSMAVLITLGQDVLTACPANLPPSMVRQQLRQALNTFRQRAHQDIETLSQQVLAVLPCEATILTYSNSGTVIAALQQAHACGRAKRVILSESRPAYDGRLQVQALITSGIAIEYSIDMGLFERVNEADVVLVGADAVFPHGVINKLGTHALAQVAHRRGLPVYSLCASTKWLPAAAADRFHIAEHPRHEVWPDAPEMLCITNRYFDTTPLDLFSGIISERGIATPDALRNDLQQQQLIPALRQFPASPRLHS